MLENLHIKNVALIEECEINFEKKLNILSGETGAGKSMVIDSLNFALGERVSKDFIRKGEKMAVVEALFSVQNPAFQNKLIENGIEVEEDGYVLISRTLNAAGKSVCRMNGCTVTVGMLKELSDSLLDIHGQHEHQSLLNPAAHIRILDQFCGKELEELMERYHALFQEIRRIDKEIQALSGNEQERAHKMDLLQFQVDEIKQSKLYAKEEEELLERRKILSNSEKLIRLSGESLELLYDGSEQASASDQLGQALQNIQMLAELDSQMQGICEALESVAALLDDSARELKRYMERLEVDPNALEEVEERLQEIYRLKRKYGNNVEEILAFCTKAQEELELLEHSEEKVHGLEKERKKIKKELISCAEKISILRREKAKMIEADIELQLHDLEMKNARFQIYIEERKELGIDGRDKIEFLISANAGEELKPLAKIASGGEMSRIMLAMKTVLSKADKIETLIFDEIDTGVSGRAAQKVAEKMSLIGRNHQIICITHLPQIAVMADSHFLIEKNSDGEKTVTSVLSLNEKQSTDEIARLIGGSVITDATLMAVKELKEHAKNWKKEI